MTEQGRSRPRGLSRRRRVAGLALGVVLLTALTAVGVAARSQLSFGSDLLLFLLATVVVSLVGGFGPAVATAVASSLLLNFWFVRPLHTFNIDAPQNVLALAVFVLIAMLVSRVVDTAARRSREAEILSALAGSVLRGEHAVPALLEQIRETFAMSSVGLWERAGDGWTCATSAGPAALVGPDHGDVALPVGPDRRLVLAGRPLGADAQRLLGAFAGRLAIALEQRRLADAAAAADRLAQSDRLRAALLDALSHDLRTPIAAAKAGISGLRSDDVAWAEDDRAELLASADAALDTLTALVTNLLDLSRVDAGVVRPNLAPVGVDDVVALALERMPHLAGRVRVELSETLPEVCADAGLLDRVVANLLDNAVRFSPPGECVLVQGRAHDDRVELRVIDRGPGIPAGEREAAFTAFRRQVDHTTGTSAGVGLGLAIARGFVEAMGATIELDDTPGGGLTVVLGLPAAVRP